MTIMEKIDKYSIDDEKIPQRFQNWNMVLISCFVAFFISKKPTIKALVIILGAHGIYKMNSEMAKFMSKVIKGDISGLKML